MEILELGNRVLVSGNRSGVVRYIGEPDFSQGKWVGIELDKPTGKNNGEINGHSYFVCPPNHGLFVKFSQIISVISKGSDAGSSARSSLASNASRLQQIRDRRASAISGSSSKRSSTGSVMNMSLSNEKDTVTLDAANGRSDLEDKVAIELTYQEPDTADAMSESINQQSLRLREEYEVEIVNIREGYEKDLQDCKQENVLLHAEIKTLQLEIGNHKTRIMQFVADEQKKAEEIAHAFAKASASNRKTEILEQKISELNDLIEIMTLEKESFEMDKEIAEERIEEYQAEIALLKLSASLGTKAKETSGTADSNGSTSAQVQEENQKLRSAIKTLHDRGNENKIELTKQIRLLQRQVAELAASKDEAESLREKLVKSTEEVEELKEQLDVASAYESMVEQLTEKNLTLADKLSELEATVQSLEALREMEEEMEHQHNEYEAELRSEMESQRNAIAELKQQLYDQKTAIEDRDRTILRFREQSSQRRLQINELKARLSEEVNEKKSLTGTAHSALNKSMNLRSLMKTAQRHEIAANTFKIQAGEYNLENAFFRKIIPETIFTESDRMSLHIRLFLIRIVGKAELVLQYLQKDLAPLAIQDVDAMDDLKVEDYIVCLPLRLQLAENLSLILFYARKGIALFESSLDYHDELVRMSDTADRSQLERGISHALEAYPEGELYVAPKDGGPRLCERINQSLKDFLNAKMDISAPSYANILKQKIRADVSILTFSVSCTASYLALVRNVLAKSNTDKTDMTLLFAQLEKANHESQGLLSISEQFFRRIEVDFGTADDDLDQSIVSGCDEIDTLAACSSQCNGIWVILQEHFGPKLLGPDTTCEIDTSGVICESILPMMRSVKDRLTCVFKSVCRGVFLDALTPGTTSQTLVSDAKPFSKWQQRAQEIQKELIESADLRSSLEQVTESLQNAHNRMREMEKVGCQLRVINQKMESDLLHLQAEMDKNEKEKDAVNAQVTKEAGELRSDIKQFRQEKAALETHVQELEEQLSRATDAETVAASMNARLKRDEFESEDSKGLLMTIRHLQAELRIYRNCLASARLLGVNNFASIPPDPRTFKDKPSEALANILAQLKTFAEEMHTDAALPRMVVLNSKREPKQQYFVNRLQLSRNAEKLESIRNQFADVIREETANESLAKAVQFGENVFGGQVSEKERPSVLRSRLIFKRQRVDDTECGQKVQKTIKVHMNHAKYKEFVQLLAS